MIPKIIHYCWFGGNPLPASAIECIESWKKYFPDYEIKEWNESNFDVNALPYTKEAYFARKYAFVSDVARLYALYHEGGIYLDTDIKFIKTLNTEFLNYKSLFSVENDHFLATSFICSEKGGEMVKSLLDVYTGLHFFHNFKFNLCPNTARFTKLIESNGIKLRNEIIITTDYVIYPQEYFSAKNYITGEYMITENTYCIHDFSSSWIQRDKNLFYKLKIRTEMFFTILKYSLN